MKLKKKRSLIPIASSQLTAMISVALVLFILGIVGLTAIATHRLTTSIKEQVGYVVVLGDDTSEQQVNAIKRHLGNSPAVASYRFASADEVLARWKTDMGADSDFDDILMNINPFFPEFEVSLRAEYVHPDSMEAAAAAVGKLPGVTRVTMNTETAREVERSVDSVIFVMLLIALALLVISFVLINNTIRLAIYARRFQIHTMKLVGATPGFIRGPFVGRNVVGGIFAALGASAALAGALLYMEHMEPTLTSIVRPLDFAAVTVGLFATGIAICALAALFATNRYIRISYEAMFK